MNPTHLNNPSVSPRQQKLQALVLLNLLGLLGYLATVYSPFHYDDYHAIVQNPYIKNLGEFQEKVGFENIFNRSILLFSFAVNHEAGGLNVIGYHLVNILIHIGVGILFFFTAGKLLSLDPSSRTHRGLPLWAGAIHMVNPMAVEAVTYISSRSSMLVTFFYLLAFYCFIQFINRGKSSRQTVQSVFLVLLALGFFFLGAGSKETIVTLPVMCAVYLWMRSPPKNLARLLPEILVIFLPVLIYLIYRYQTLGVVFELHADPSKGLTGRSEFFFTQIYAVVFYYLLKLFFPFNLNFEPDIRLVSGFFDPQCLAGLGVLAILAWVVYYQKSFLVRFACLWVLVTLLPTSSFIPLKQIVNEHRLYLPGLGVSLFLGAMFVRVRELHRFAGFGLLGFLILTFVLTVNRSLDFRTQDLLWEDTVKKSPGKVLVHNNLAAELIKQKRFAEAERELLIIQKLDPTYPNAYSNRGHIYFHRGQWQKSQEAFGKAISLGSDDPPTYYNAGMVRLKLEKPAEALPYILQAVKMQANVAEYYFGLGNVYMELARFDQALSAFRQALKYNPDDADTHNNIGVIFWKLKSLDLAEAEFKQALAIDPQNNETKKNLANVYMVSGQYSKAIPYLEGALKSEPNNETIKDLLKIATTLGEKIPQ